MTDVRRLAYCSRAHGGSKTAVPSQLAGILIQSRQFNKANAITGYLSYRAGTYFQILEGPNNRLGDLYARICRDSRHRDVELIFDNVGETERLFESWNLQLATRGSRLAEVGRFFEIHGDAIADLDPSILRRVMPFMPSDGDGVRANEPGEAVGITQFRLKSIPLNLSELDALPSRMQVLSAILTDWMSVDELADSTGLSQELIASTLKHPVIRARVKKRKFERAETTSQASVSKVSSSSRRGRDRLQSFFSRFF